MTRKQRRLCAELAASVRLRLQSLRGLLAERLDGIHRAALAHKVEEVELDIIHATTLLSVIVCGWGELGLRASKCMILDEEDLPDADSIPWDKYSDADLYAWRIVAEELANLIVELWTGELRSAVPVIASYHGSELVHSFPPSP
jgi:hypothetical protein